MCNGESMGLLAGINARRSCRAYKDTPLSPALLKSVFEYATFSLRRRRRKTCRPARTDA